MKATEDSEDSDREGEFISAKSDTLAGILDNILVSLRSNVRIDTLTTSRYRRQ